jgi:AcrR family transcriptional regulator
MTAREGQRRRTRAAIVAAAMDLLEQGQTPSLSEVADAADVSRRTVYLHFPTVEQLLIDATVGALSQRAVDDAIEAADPGGDDAEARVDAMIDALAGLSSETLPLGRTLIRLTVDAPSTEEGAPRRGYRRINWIERAIEPLRADLPPHEFERLLSGLAMVIGWEALVVLQDIRGLTADAQVETSRWAARALIAAAVPERR